MTSAEEEVVATPARPAWPPSARTTTSLADVADEIADHGDVHIVSAMYPMQADSVLGAGIAAALGRGHRVTLFAADLAGRYGFITDEIVAHPRFRLVTIGGRVPRRLQAVADFVPGSLWEIDRRMRDGTIPVDVFVAQAAPPDDAGYCRLGPVVSFSDAALRRARKVVLEVNWGVPGMDGYRGPHVDDVTLFYDGGRKAIDPWPPRVLSDEQAFAMGRNVAQLIPDGATLQLGIGSVPEGILAALAGKRDLGIHSGAIPEAAIELIEAGVISGRRKPVDPGLHVTTSLLGSDRLYAYAADPASHIVLRPVHETHDPAVLASIPGLFAVNSAVEVDLSGQANAEFAAGRRVSSAGGQPDFGRAGHLSEGGANIIALVARSADGAPRIVARFRHGQPVTNNRNDVDVVVTEYGVADLRGRTFGERASLLIGIAHPDDRATLRRDLAESGVGPVRSPS